MARLDFWLLAAGALASASSAAAQADQEFSLEEPSERAPEQRVPEPIEKAPTAEGPPMRLGDEQALEEERGPAERFRETTDPYEDPRRRYFFAGAGWRLIHVPSWLLGAYAVESGPSVGTPASVFGEFAYRKGGFQVLTSVGFVKWNFKGPFQLNDDPIEDTEWLDAKLKLVVASAAITWSTSFADWFQLEYGLEAGFGFLFGDLVRNEAVRRANGKWGKCESWASQVPDATDLTLYNRDFPYDETSEEDRRFCDPPLVDDPTAPPPATNAPDEDGAHYGASARGIFNGGLPRVVPVLGPRLSLRFKPIHQLVLRIDVPLPSVPFGFTGGAGLQYGF